MTFNLADLFESIAAAVPSRDAVVAGERRLTYRQLDERANRLAHAFTAAGIQPGDRVGLMLVNGTEYIEGMLAAFKLRAIPVNVNYRYVSEELRHLFDDADLVGLVLHRRFVPQVAAVARDLPLLQAFWLVDDGSCESVLPGALDYEAALSSSSAVADFGPRSSGDIYCAYTGGTTGLPKGVLWRHEDIFFAAMGGGDPMHTGNPISRPEELVDRVPAAGLVALATPPLMHVSAHWLAFLLLLGGGTLVVVPGGHFDAGVIWELVERERVNMLVIVGDAMARPLADVLSAAPSAYNTSSLFVVGSGGAILSPSTKEQLAALLPGVVIADGLAASETGVLGNQTVTAGSGGSDGPRFTVNDETAVLDDELRPVQAGSGQVGRLARRGRVPLGYHKDPVRTSSTFVEMDGARWALPGDLATVEADGTVVLLGRGSSCINTGGEKVFPEEVEAALKAHPAVLDASVVGQNDERWGQQVVALVEVRPGATISPDEVKAHCRARLAGYKVPRQVHLVDKVLRLPNGKPDYRWARDQLRD